MKTCKRYKKLLPSTTKYFSKQTKSADGLFLYCKSCQAEINHSYAAQYIKYKKEFKVDSQYRKKCSVCNKTKHFTEYVTKSDSADGLYEYCKECQSKIEKLCTKCKTIKPLTDFFENQSNADGYDNYCKSCNKDCKPCAHCGETKYLSEYNFRIDKPEVRYEYCKECQSKIEKLCTKCKTYKPLSSFYHKGEHGYTSHCKECIALAQKLEHYKFCEECNQWKKRSEFYQSRITSDGLHVFCKDCCITSESVYPKYRRNRDLKHYCNYWGGDIGIPHAKNTNNYND